MCLCSSVTKRTDNKGTNKRKDVLISMAILSIEQQRITQQTMFYFELHAPEVNSLDLFPDNRLVGIHREHHDGLLLFLFSYNFLFSILNYTRS